MLKYLLVAAAGVLASAPAFADNHACELERPVVLAEKGDVNQGRALFIRQRCVVCHAVSPGATPVGPSPTSTASGGARVPKMHDPLIQPPST